MTGRILVWIDGIGPHLVNVSEMSFHFWDGQDDTEMTSPDEWDWWTEISPPNYHLLTTMSGNRRGFMRCIAGAFVASAIEIRLATAPVVPVATPTVAPTSVLSNEVLDRIYARLTEAASEAWFNRQRAVYEMITSPPCQTTHSPNKS